MEETLAPKMVKKTRARRVRYRGPALKFPFVKFLLSKFSLMVHFAAVIPNYVFDENEDPR